jgi:dTDP-4-amino-4,6-dideoxygalactose transaminase
MVNSNISLSNCSTYMVGEPELPEFDKYNKGLEAIWHKKEVTNFGTYHRLFEAALQKYLKCENVVLYANGTTALEALVSTLGVSNFAITSPYSFVATVSALKRNNISPFFVDVEPNDWNIGANGLTDKAVSEAGLILGTHTYGYPSDVKQLEKKAKQFNIPLIFDAAHAMGARYKNKHLVNYGDASVLSFHATKILSSFEGGAIITHDNRLADELKLFRSFGFNVGSGPPKINSSNSKMSEAHALCGLLQLEKFDETLQKRRSIFYQYYEHLKNFEGIEFIKPKKDAVINGSYVPLLVKECFADRNEIMHYLRKYNIHTKAYFSYNLASLSKTNMKYDRTDNLTKKVLCMPIHSKLSKSDVNFICDKILSYKSISYS